MTVVERNALPRKIDGNGLHPPGFPFDIPTNENHLLNAQYQDHITEIEKFRIDIGQSVGEITRWHKRLPNFNNLKDKQKQKVLGELKQEREQLAIMNFPNYISIWSEVNPEDEEKIANSKADFYAADQTEEGKAKISEQARKTLNESIVDKERFYTQMIITVYVDSGIPYEEAKELAGSKSSELQRTSAIHEKANLLKAHKEQALRFLVSTLDYSIRVWEELFPGMGEEEKARITSESDETQRTKLAKDLYKKTQEELQKRKESYHKALEANLHETGPISYIGSPMLEANKERLRLDTLPRTEQIRALNHYQKLHKSE